MNGAARIFTMDDQRAFARLSGDANPLHVDELAARRTVFGYPVVHGIHILLWALEAHADSTQAGSIEALDVHFEDPVLVGREVRCEVLTGGGRRQIRVYTGDRLAADIAFRLGRGAPEAPRSGAVEFRSAPSEPTGENLAGQRGSWPLTLDAETFGSVFPALLRFLAPSQLAFLLASSRLVGMECPGLHSLYAQLHLRNGPDRAAELHYDVTSYDARFGLAVIAIGGSGLSGQVKAFRRPPPQGQLSFGEAQKIVEPDEFAGQRALVVGGSRGLGEVSAKLLAAGGAQVLITYHRGQREAEAVAGDVQAGGGRIAVAPLNVLDKRPTPPVEFETNTLYYWATPHYAVPPGPFDPGLFRTFLDFYVTGFVSLGDPLLRKGGARLYYPSSVAISERPSGMDEYAAAKQEGELQIARWRTAYPDAVIYAPRLPRLATDQTASMMSVRGIDTTEHILGTLRCFRDA